jgi:hypothetical protein
MSDQDKQEKQHFWDIHEENGLLHLLDPDKHMYAYVKWDGEIHVWYYDDGSMGFDHDTGLKDYTEYGFKGKSHHDYYDMFDIDEQIARLQSLREVAAKWFAENKQKRWPPDWENYRTSKIDIEQAQELPPQRKG